MGFQETVEQAGQIAAELTVWMKENFPGLVTEHPELLEKALLDGQVYRSDYVADQVIANLLSAHKRVSHAGNICDLIELSKYLLEVSKLERNVIVNGHWVSEP